MKKWLILLIIFIPISVYAGFGITVYDEGQTASGGVACNSVTDRAGYDAGGSTLSDLTEDRMYCNRWLATEESGCLSGTVDEIFALHIGTDTDNIKVGVYESSGVAPSASDGLVVFSSEITGSADDTWYSEEVSSGGITLGSYYWICFITDSTAWRAEYSGSSGIPIYYKNSVGYSSPPATLADDYTEIVGGRSYNFYFTIK